MSITPPINPGTQRGPWTVLGVVGHEGGFRLYECVCKCGEVEVLNVIEFRGVKRCQHWDGFLPAWARYADDPLCQVIVQGYAKPNGGMTLDEVGVVLGVSKERIRQIEQRIFTKIRCLDVGTADSLEDYWRDINQRDEAVDYFGGEG